MYIEAYSISHQDNKREIGLNTICTNVYEQWRRTNRRSDKSCAWEPSSGRDGGMTGIVYEGRNDKLQGTHAHSNKLRGRNARDKRGETNKQESNQAQWLRARLLTLVLLRSLEHAHINRVIPCLYEAVTPTVVERSVSPSMNSKAFLDNNWISPCSSPTTSIF